MNKKLKTSKDATNPYRTFGYKIAAPIKSKAGPKATVANNGGDLRAKGGK